MHHTMIEQQLRVRISTLDAEVAQLKHVRTTTDDDNDDNGKNSHDPTNDQTDEQQFVMTVSRAVVPRIISVGGNHIRDIKTKTDVKIIVFQDEGSMAEVTITGSRKAVKQARDIVEALIANNYEVIGGVSVMLVIPEANVSKLIGHRGSNIKMLQKTS